MREPGHDPAGLAAAIDDLATTRALPIARIPVRADPAEDAVALAAAAAGHPPRPADPEVAAAVGTEAAALAAAGALGWERRLAGRWWRALTGPLVVDGADGPAAIVPDGARFVRIRAGTRRARPLDGATAADVGPRALAIAEPLPADPRLRTLVRWALRRRAPDLLALALLGLVGGVAGLLLPLATQAIFQQAVPDGDTGAIVAILAGLALGTAGVGVVLYARGLTVVRIRDAFDAVLAPAVGARLLGVRTGFFRDRTTGEVVNRALSVEAARAQVEDHLVAAALTSAFGLVNILFLFALDPFYGLVGGAAALVALAASTGVELRARRRLPALLEARSRTDATLQGLVLSLVSWRVTGLEERAFARWARDQAGSTRALVARLRATELSPVIDAVGPAAVLLVFIAVVFAVPGERLRPGSPEAPGTFLALYIAVIQLAVAMTQLGAQVTSLAELGPILARALPIVAAPEERTEAARPPGRLDGAVALDRVTFGYRPDAPPIVRDLSLAVRPGEMVAIVGPSGGGKSTLLRLLLGFETPWSGAVTYDGQDLAGLDIVAVRRQIGTVLQASRPLGDTIASSVRGPRMLPDDAVWDLLAEAGLADDVCRMPGGLDAPVGPGGSGLSGGQRQRLVIAAALAGRPRILYLDEATSALDNVTQAVVMRTILGAAATRIVIAHRLTTVQAADRVLVVADGGIAEEGTPAELLRQGGRFARLAARDGV
ncbi:MAG: ATP-binding cassette domain-containing protein [Chloroflexota bacterium]